MKSILSILLLLSLLGFLSCDNKSKEIKKDKTESEAEKQSQDSVLMPDTDQPLVEASKELDTLAELESLVLPGYEKLGHRYGDLNRDSLTNDLVLALKKSDEENYDFENPSPRPLLVFTRQEDGRLKEVARNDQTILCQQCGGVFGDPFSGLAVKNGYFSVEHYGGSNYRWTKIITYKYDEKSNAWQLHKVGEENYHTGSPDKVETHIQSVKDFGKVAFADYSVYN